MKGSSRRPEQVAETLRQVIADALTRGEVRDPRIGFVTLTGVLVTNDLSHARVMVSVPGAEAERTRALQGLQSAAGSADGAKNLLSYANQIAAEQTLQLMQMRALCNQMLEEAAARDAALANRRALMDVFGCHLKNKDNKMLQTSSS